jgi:hypothetical protein
MPVIQSDIILYGSASMPDTDTPTDIGGAIALTKKMGFADLSTPSLVEIVSSQAADITQTITISYRTTAGVLSTEVKTLSGLTPVAYVATMERLLKAIKNATTAGDAAIMTSTAERTGTAQAGAANTITLDAGASAVDDFYTSMVIRLTSGTGANQILSIIKYVGSTKVATVSRAWTVNPDATSVFRVARGMLFDKSPSEIFEVRRFFFDASANPPAGATKTYYDKGFFKNTHGTLALTSAVIAEVSDPATIAFSLETSLDGTDTNGGGNNRQVAPSGHTFTSATKNVANSQNHTAGAAQGCWAELTLVGGAAALNVVYQIKEQGNTT